MKARQEFGNTALHQDYMRDVFAAKAMQAELIAQDAQVYLWKDTAALAERAYSVAEAMLKERLNWTKP